MRLLISLALCAIALPAFSQSLAAWQTEFPKADFSQSEVPFTEISFDGARRDSIPPIHNPVYKPLAGVALVKQTPVISVVIRGEAKAYPLEIMLWHEIVTETIGGVPVLVTYCPLCNSGVVFDRRVNGEVLEFGNTGRIRHFDMVMYDQSTESWWQQFSGRAIIGTRTGQTMKLLPSRLESLAAFAARAPDGMVLVPNNPAARPYGNSPYPGMDTPPDQPRLSAQFPVPKGIDPMAYFVVVGNQAWPLERLRSAGTIRESGLILNWTPGRSSIHDTRDISKGRDLGNVTVAQAETPKRDFPYDLVFAFAFSAFLPNGEWMLVAP